MTPDPKPTEALKPWHPGPAQGGENIWQDGDVLLIAVDTNQGWDFALVSITADEDSASMRDPETGDFRSEWGFEDIHYWIRREDIPKLWNTRDRDAELAAMREALNEAKELAARIMGIIETEQFPKDTLWIPTIRAHAYVIEGDAEHALASTAGTELPERLRLAVEERDQARIERDTEQQFHQRSDAKLAAVTERDEEKAIVDRVWKALGISTYEQAKPFAIDEHVTRLRDRAAAAESVSSGLRKELDELQEILRQIPNT